MIIHTTVPCRRCRRRSQARILNETRSSSLTKQVGSPSRSWITRLLAHAIAFHTFPKTSPCCRRAWPAFNSRTQHRVVVPKPAYHRKPADAAAFDSASAERYSLQSHDRAQQISPAPTKTSNSRHATSRPGPLATLTSAADPLPTVPPCHPALRLLGLACGPRDAHTTQDARSVLSNRAIPSAILDIKHCPLAACSETPPQTTPMTSDRIRNDVGSKSPYHPWCHQTLFPTCRNTFFAYTTTSRLRPHRAF